MRYSVDFQDATWLAFNQEKVVKLLEKHGIEPNRIAGHGVSAEGYLKMIDRKYGTPWVPKYEQYPWTDPEIWEYLWNNVPMTPFNEEEEEENE